MDEAYLLRIFAKVNKLNNVPSFKKPVFIIKYGPPASGKGSNGVRGVIESFGYPANTYINVNVDDVIESLNSYKKNSRKLLNDMGLTTAQQINAMLEKATNKNAEQFIKPYMNTRFNKTLSIPAQMDSLMQNAILARKNITFETTGGTGFPYWIFQYLKGLEEYDFKIIFPLVELSEGWRRYKRRPINSYLRGNVFRFGSSKKQYRDQYIKSYEQFLSGEQVIKSGKYGSNFQFYVVPEGNGPPMQQAGAYIPVVSAYLSRAKTEE